MPNGLIYRAVRNYRGYWLHLGSNPILPTRPILTIVCNNMIGWRIGGILKFINITAFMLCSSSGSGYYPLKVKIMGSNPIRSTVR